MLNKTAAQTDQIYSISTQRGHDNKTSSKHHGNGNTNTKISQTKLQENESDPTNFELTKQPTQLTVSRFT